jgi:hypothetical protein
MNKNVIHKGNDFEIELEVDDPDYTLLGNRIEQWIQAHVPNFILWIVKKLSKENDCGCNKRKEWLNNKHLDYRERKLDKAQSHYDLARHKLNILKIRYKQ